MKIKGKFNINDFNQIMDIAQIIYIEDNPWTLDIIIYYNIYCS